MKFATKLAAALLLGAAFSGPAIAGLEEGRAALKKKDYTAAFKEFMPLAQKGNPEAQYYIGMMHETGYGAAENEAEALGWFRKSAAGGNVHAQYMLGYKYRRGGSVPKDAAKAIEWYRKAAAQGDREAQYELGSMYSSGDGVSKDVAAAMEWYRKAAAQGHAEARVQLCADQARSAECKP